MNATATLQEQASAAAGRAFDAMMNAGGPDAELCSAMCIPPNAPDAPVIAPWAIAANTRLPFRDDVVARIQTLFDSGIAVYVVTTDRAFLSRVVAVLRMLAGAVAPACAESAL